MGRQKPPKQYYATIIAVVALSAVGCAVFFDGFSVDSWFNLLILTVLILYLQNFIVDLGERMSYSLSTATIFPLIYFFGTTWSMLIPALSGLADGIINKKSIERTVFNIAQFLLSGLLGSLVFLNLSSALAPFRLGELFAMVLGMLTYICVNLLLVTRVVSLWKRITWWDQLNTYGFASFHNSLANSFIGLIFTFFIKRYDSWGIVIFSGLLIYLSGLLKTAASVSGERSRRRELEGELLVDELTQVYNFRFLSQWLGDPSEENVAVLFLDVDEFKEFNDRYGHVQGDRVLKLLAETVKNSVRANDKVIRYGGDEFVVLLFDMTKEEASATAERIVEKLDETVFSAWERPVTISVGLAASPQDTVDKRRLLLMSDQAMYSGKGRRENTIRIWKPEDVTA